MPFALLSLGRYSRLILMTLTLMLKALRVKIAASDYRDQSDLARISWPADRLGERY